MREDFEFSSADYISDYKQYSKQKKLIKVAVFIFVLGVIVLDVALVKNLFKKVDIEKDREADYNSAIELMEKSFEKADMEGLQNALNTFAALDEYKDAPQYLSMAEERLQLVSQYSDGKIYYENDIYANAFSTFSSIIELWDSRAYINDMAEKLYKEAQANFENNGFTKARASLTLIISDAECYEEAQELLAEIVAAEKEYNNAMSYNEAVSLYDNGELVLAQQKFLTIPDYLDSEEYISNIGSAIYDNAKANYDNGSFGECVNLVGYIDTMNEWTDYSKATALKSKAVSEYSSYINENAMKVLDTEGYDKFESFVRGSVNAAFSSAEADALISAHEPVSVYTMTPFEEGEWQAAPNLGAIGWSNRSLRFEEGVRDCDGNSYGNALMGGGCYSKYYLGGKYSYLTGTMFVVEGCKATTDKPVFLVVRNGEEEELYRGELLSGYGPKTININVKGQESVTIYFDGFVGDFVSDDYFGGIGNLSLIP